MCHINFKVTAAVFLAKVTLLFCSFLDCCSCVCVCVAATQQQHYIPAQTARNFSIPHRALSDNSLCWGPIV